MPAKRVFREKMVCVGYGHTKNKVINPLRLSLSAYKNHGTRDRKYYLQSRFPKNLLMGADPFYSKNDKIAFHCIFF